MRKLLPLVVLFLLACIALSCGSKNEKTKTGSPQNNDYLVSMDGVDSLKLEMTKAELEKLLNTKLSLPNSATDSGADTLNVKYRDMDMTLYMFGSSDSTATLRGIQTSNASCKTANGIGMGSNKMQVIDAYPDHGKYVAPEYEQYPVRSTTRYAIGIPDTAMSTKALIFHLIDKKVVSMEITSYFEFY